MSNMSYCRFENTNDDLKDCEEALSEMEGSYQDFYDSLSSDHERRGFKALMKRIERMANEFDVEELQKCKDK